MAGGTVISAAVEGIVDEAVVRKLIAHADATPGDMYGKQGKSFLRQRIAGYNNAAQRMPWCRCRAHRAIPSRGAQQASCRSGTLGRPQGDDG